MPDHPWAKPNVGSFQLTLRCDECKEKYTFTEQSTNAVLLRKNEVEQLEKERHGVYERQRALERSVEVKGYLAEFVVRLASTKTAMDKYRLLEAAGFSRQSVGAFNKELKRRSLEDIVSRGFYIAHVDKLLKIIGRENSTLVKTVEEMERRKEELEEPLTPVWSSSLRNKN